MNAVRYVKTTGDGGNDAADGLSWDTAKATIAAALASLPTDGTSHHGTINIGAGTFVETGNLELNWGIEYVGNGTDNAGNGTVIQLANSANAWLFTPTAAWLGDGTPSNFSHHTRIRNCRLNGNESNQTEAATVTSVNLTFANGPAPTITRASGDWGADGYQVGDYIEVRHDPNGNDGMYEVKSIDSATVLRLWDTNIGGKRAHELISSGPTAGITVVGCRYGLVRLFNGGFNTFFDNVMFESSRIGLLTLRSALNVDLWRCTGSQLTCRWLFFRTYGDVQVNVLGSQVDDTGHSVIEIHRNHTAAGHIFNFIGGKWETADTEKHRHLILVRPFENGVGSPYAIHCAALKSNHTVAAGSDDYMFYERPAPGGGARAGWSIIGCMASNSTGLFRSRVSGRIIGTVSAGVVDSRVTVIEGHAQGGCSLADNEIVSSPSALVAGNNTVDLITNDATMLRLSGDAGGSSVIGFSGGRDGRKLLVVALNGTVTLKHENTSATAANRIHFTSGSDFVMAQDNIAEMVYDNTTQRWRAWKYT